MNIAYLKPAAFTQKVFNPIAKMLGIGGSCELRVAGRKSGAVQSIPVIPVETNGGRYIVSTRGESEWVRNVRAVRSVEIRCKGESKKYRAVEIPVADRAAVIAKYREVAGKTVGGYWKSLPNDSDHPVFRLDRA